MTSLLVIIVLVLLAIALWQLTKIFDLTQVGQTAHNTQVASDADNKVQGYLMFGFLAFLYIFMIYGLIVWGPLVLDNPASEHGKDVDLLMNITWLLIFIVQFITQLLLHYFAFKYRGTKDSKALYFADNNKLEVIWSTIPAVVLAGLILYGLYAWTNIMFVDEQEEDVIVVEVYAKQFGWEARYSGGDNVLGKANVRYIQGVNTVGVDMADPNAQDDKMSTELYIPKGKKVLIKMRSQDVLHSAYMPHFRAQMNCVPGMVTQFAFIPTLTTEEYRAIPKIEEKIANINKIRAAKSAKLTASGQTALDPYEFNYLLLCNKICGASHYNMQMKVVVVSQEEYKTWLADKPTLAQQIKEANAPAAPATPTLVPDSTAVEAPIVVLAN
ncbi:cytochrome c oxidase subunit II [Flavobacterium sp.]|jgi:cytochrome c oxidase subunit 2|uniref:cytochrome c oxidase subunit II n=1 Tax=Flavobacterium sp. TaxID=239 RepID=UPI0037BEC2D3